MPVVPLPCLCIACCAERGDGVVLSPYGGPSFVAFRYACEICGNKRCPHHSDHRLACTGSNEPGQPGSIL